MATIGLFISPSQIKEQTPIDENVDEKTLRESILYCQDEYTKAICGTALYDEIKGQIEAGTITALNTTLRDSYLRPSLKWWVVYEAMDELHTKFTNKSIVNKKSDNSDPVSITEILSLKNKYRNRAERLDEKARLYLVENTTDYPLYLNPGTGSDTIHPKGLTYGTGWYLGDSDSDRYNTPSGNCCE